MAYTRIPREDLDIGKQIGTGGFSSVFKAKWKSKDVHVAAKRLNKPDRNEIEVLSELDHPNIVNLLGVIDKGYEFFLILELCEEGSLRSYLDKHRGETLKQFYDWAKQAGRPIEYLNKKKIIHKDVKSPNYLVANGNVLKLADFGLAKRTDITITATERASYAWMAPELLAEDKLSPSYDVFAYMVVVWELWTTQIPFEGSCPENIIYRVCRGNERLPIPLDMPTPLADLMRQCWDKDRSKRPSIDKIFSVLIRLEKEAQVKAKQLQQQYIAGPWMSVKEFGHQDGPGKLLIACGIAVNPTTDDIAVADFGSLCVKVYNNEGEYRFSLDTTQGTALGRGSRPWNVIASTEGTYYVTDNTEQLKVYTREELYKLVTVSHEHTTQGTALGRGSRPWNVIASTEGTYYVTDNTEHVKVYTGEGLYKCKWVTVSHEHTHISKHTDLRGLTMDRNGQLLVGQVSEPTYISKHHQDGLQIASIKVGIAPFFLATTSQDTIIMGNFYRSVVQIVDNTGELLHTINPCVGYRGHIGGLGCYQDIIFIGTTRELNTHEITCYTEHGEHMGSIPVQMLPKGITFTKDGHKLLIACEDQVQVYACKK